MDHIEGFEEVLDRAIYENNCTVHSVINKRTLEVFFGGIATVAPENYEQARLDNIDRPKKKKIMITFRILTVITLTNILIETDAQTVTIR
ncbi:GM11717 [Drosophila sechellia]|uniref:GM11717 n=1 Tax=Drosophila sechellia TaxID=7238 RepID=B4IQ60_DROSE|nr:GM11717 [Drosophila sechellia]